jgi:hypothetical protein
MKKFNKIREILLESISLKEDFKDQARANRNQYALVGADLVDLLEFAHNHFSSILYYFDATFPGLVGYIVDENSPNPNKKSNVLYYRFGERFGWVHSETTLKKANGVKQDISIINKVGD